VVSLRDRLRGPKDRDAAALVGAAVEKIEKRWPSDAEMRKLREVRAIVEAPDELRRECVLEAARRTDTQASARALSVITRKRIELRAQDIEALLSPLQDQLPDRERWQRAVRISILSRHIEYAYPRLDDDAQARLRPLLEQALVDTEYDAPAANRFRTLLRGGEELPYSAIDDGDDVGPRLRALLETSAESDEARAAALGLLAAYPMSGRPGKKWVAEADRVRGLLAQPSALVAAVLDAALEASDTEIVYSEALTGTSFSTDRNESLLCGAAVFAGIVADPGLLERLRRLAVKSVTVIGGQFGFPRSLKLANACAKAIADIGAPASLTELLALERSIRHGTLLKQVRKAIDALADAQGMTRDELLERAVETHGLDRDGTRRVPLSRGAALIEVDARAASLVYLDEGGKRRKTVPAAVKEADGDTLTELRDDLKGIRKTVAGERTRLDALMALDRRWPVADWRSLYLDHPVTGRLSRALIWGFRGGDGTDVLGIPCDATTAVTSSGDEVEIPDDAEIRLWHPVHADAADVHAWRLHLLEQLVVQPFKQAFREVYLLTPAEEQTRVYSNRFASHVFGQVQARALMKGRGWKPVPVAWWDDGIDHGVARRTFESFGIRAEFFFDPIFDIQPTSGDLYPYCTSDQVRFYDGGRDRPLELRDVPLLVLTETMRDVDLFVGVTSIGADPQWLDRGEGRRFETYWNAYSFGELTAAAEIRREVLEHLLPQLAIADRCELEERCLVVRGDLRTYRIHLGSSNILMSPNDRYLCIVATRDPRADKLFLPFDDDPVLSLILSKAFLLARDAAITDETITRQIESG
jgi:uncharacterized protein DUF4132